MYNNIDRKHQQFWHILQCSTMCTYLMCLTSKSGIPIFTRKIGKGDNISRGNMPFSTIASLNGFHMFFKSVDITVETAYSDDWTYIWKDFDSLITLIICGKAKYDENLGLMAEYIFYSFALFIKRDEFSSPLIFEKMKRESKKFLPVIDYVLESKNIFCRFTSTFCSIFTVENNYILNKLNEFSTQCGSLFCSIVFKYKILIGTEAWWDLSVIDRFLLFAILKSSKGLQNDMPVYLPIKSPMIAYRFVVILIPTIGVLCAVCGSEPSYGDLISKALNIFGNESNLLRKLEQCVPRSISKYTDESIKGILIFNEMSKKCFFSTKLHQDFYEKSAGHPIPVNILETLFDYYHYSSLNYVLNLPADEIMEMNVQYTSSKYHNSFVKSDDKGNVMFVLFIPSFPAYTMKYLSEHVMRTLQKIW